MLLRVLVWLWLVLLLLLLRPDHGTRIAMIDRLDGLMHVLLARLGEDTHDHCASAVGPLVLTEVIRSGELLTAVRALKGLLVGVE